MAKMIKVTLTKSVIGASPKQKKVVEALGLKKMHQSVELIDSPVTRGAINKVSASFDCRRAIGWEVQAK